MKSRNMRKKTGALAVVLACSAMLGACGNPLEAVIAKPVFKVGSESCSKDDAKVILMNYQKEYSNLYGIDMWEHDYGQEQSLEDYIKDLTLAQTAHVDTVVVITSNSSTLSYEINQK